MRALGAASSMPVGSPSRPRTICPPLGSGVSLSNPAARSAARLRTADWYRWRTNTGVSGAAAFSSATVGSRRSANWSADQPPTTRTHWPFGVRAACSRSIARA